jgi:predicted DNA binding CopG/RHH family protein
MNRDRWDALLEQDWSTAWESLPEAPALVVRPKTAQITLRLPVGMLRRIKRVAAVRSMPYHVLVRSWLVDALREAPVPPGELPIEPHTEQLNLKLGHELLDRLKARAHELGRPYHRLARELIDATLAHEEEALGLADVRAGRPGIKELMVLLLHVPNARGQDAIRGITRLQKLLFVLEQTLGARTGGFYAYSYGPFNEGVNDAAKALELAGFVKRGESRSGGPPSFAEMIASASERAGPRERPEEFALNEQGHTAAERLRRSSRAYEQLFERVRELREQWDTPDLVDRVYEAWPQYAERSVIKDEVAARRARRRPSEQ